MLFLLQLGVNHFSKKKTIHSISPPPTGTDSHGFSVSGSRERLPQSVAERQSHLYAYLSLFIHNGVSYIVSLIDKTMI